MARRLLRTAGRLGVDAAGQELLGQAFEVGMGPRFARGLDDHHPDYLHPARTALILMDDARVDRAVPLAAALVVETRDPTLRPGPAGLASLGPAVVALAEAVPAGSETDTLMERLVTAEEPARLVALAERLDHARHLHLRERDEWAAYHATTCEVYAPVARRTNAALAGRLAWWCATFRQRFLEGG
jgi:(p)ppGpp synthase/HD superfamily hydrolase